MNKKSSVGKVVRASPESVTLISDRSVTACGCKRIEKYTSGEIILELCDTVLRISGENMTLNIFCGDEIEIRGKISNVGILP